jgi:Tfp pilus assembly protein PilF
LDVALAGILEQQGKISEAEEKLKSALKREPRSRKALTGYARFLDRRERHAEAIETYKRAVALHPNEASIHNDLALCHARHREFNESHEALSRAVALDGKSVRYRNNMAMICVEMGSLQEAYRHLEDAHGPAIAHYNLGHLLLQKGDLGGAAGAFARALEVNPGFTDAREMLAGLEGTGPADAYPGGGLASLPERRFSETFGSSDVSQRGTSRSTSPNVRRLPPVRYETAVPTP